MLFYFVPYPGVHYGAAAQLRDSLHSHPESFWPRERNELGLGGGRQPGDQLRDQPAPCGLLQVRSTFRLSFLLYVCCSEVTSRWVVSLSELDSRQTRA